MQLVDLGPLFDEGGHGQLMMGPHVAVRAGPPRGLPTASIGDAFPMMTASIGDAPFPADDMPGLGDLMEMTSMRMAPPPMIAGRRRCPADRRARAARTSRAQAQRARSRRASACC